MAASGLVRVLVAALVLVLGGRAVVTAPASEKKNAGLQAIETVVVIYAENRSFDNLYGYLPGANGLRGLKSAQYQQRDRGGEVLHELPPIWKGLTARNQQAQVGEEKTGHLPNRPFAIDDPRGFNAPLSVRTRDLWHRFYQNQMQINGGKNDMFVAWGNAGALPMGHYDGSKLPLWKIAHKYTLADNFFMAAFGGSFLKHFWLICACTPIYPEEGREFVATKVSALELDGAHFRAQGEIGSAMDGAPKFANDQKITPDFRAVNTLQPPYQPSGVKPTPRTLGSPTRRIRIGCPRKCRRP